VRRCVLGPPDRDHYFGEDQKLKEYRGQGTDGGSRRQHARRVHGRHRPPRVDERATKKDAQEKLARFTPKIGYPDRCG
jgi:hypothetical protein